MTRILRKSLIAGLAASTIGLSALTGSASAGGSFSVSYAPTDPQQAQALQAGLGLYSLFNGIQNGASIQQLGMNNLAGIGQNGAGNNGIIEQYGDGHSATLQQNGNGNSYGIFQFGEGTSTDVVQNGDRNAGVTFAFGW
jgi:hypothetical protein